MSNSLWTHGLYSPWNSLGQNTLVGSHSLLQGIFPTQGLNPGFPHCRQILYQQNHKWSPRILELVAYLFSSGFFRPRNRTRVYDLHWKHIKTAIILPTKVCIVKAMVFPVVMYGCESWTIKSAECWRSDAFVLWCWRRFLIVPWTARKLNQSILKEVSPEYSLERVMLKF